MKRLHREFPSSALAAGGCLLPALLVAVWLGAGMPWATAAPGAWDVKKIAGDDYVSTDNIKQFYNFTKQTRNGSAITLENAKIMVSLNIGSTECTMNKVKFVFSKPVEEVDITEVLVQYQARHKEVEVLLIMVRIKLTL